MKKFQKKVEDFVCDHCGLRVKGNGYTNHCPDCLWSKHVDINPGDRENDCGGQMEPAYAYFQKGRWRIVHLCKKCNERTDFYASGKDELDEIIKLSTKPIK